MQITNFYELLKVITFCLIIFGIFGVSFLFHLYGASSDLHSLFIVLIKAIVSFSAVIILLTGLWSFWSDHFPALGVEEVNSGKAGATVELKFRNYSKSILRNVAINYILFEIIEPQEIYNIKRFSYSHPGQSTYVGPNSMESIIIAHPWKDFNVSKIKGKLFLLIYLKVEAPFMPLFFTEITDIWHYDADNQEWYGKPEGSKVLRSTRDAIFDLLKEGKVSHLKKIAIQKFKEQRRKV